MRKYEHMSIRGMIFKIDLGHDGYEEPPKPKESTFVEVRRPFKRGDILVSGRCSFIEHFFHVEDVTWFGGLDVICALDGSRAGLSASYSKNQHATLRELVDWLDKKRK